MDYYISQVNVLINDLKNIWKLPRNKICNHHKYLIKDIYKEVYVISDNCDCRTFLNNLKEITDETTIVEIKKELFLLSKI